MDDTSGNSNGAGAAQPSLSALPGPQREVAEAAERALAAGPGALLLGPSGIGKSHLVAALTARARAAGTLVLACAPAEAELQLPFVSLIDLLAPIPDAVLDRLPLGQRAALRAALLRGQSSEAAPGGPQVRVAVLTLLRGLAARRTVWIVADDLAWMDQPTAEILAFVSRRTAGLALRVLAPERVAPGAEPAHADLCPPGTAQLTVPPLNADELRAMLETRTGTTVTPALAREIHRAARGNPLYAIELHRAHPAATAAATTTGIGASPITGTPGSWSIPDTAPDAEPAAGVGEPQPVPPRLRALLLGRLRVLPDPVRTTLLLAAAAGRPDPALLERAGGPAVPADLHQAAHLGVLREAPDGQLEFEHPLLRTVIYTAAPGHERRAAHAALAAAGTEPVERARHRALADPAQDEHVAGDLMRAAHAARHRGAPATAADLAELAAARTPAHAEHERARRALAAAEYAYDAGAWERARRTATALLTAASANAIPPDPQVTVGARIMLVKTAGQALEGTGELIDAGIAEAAGHPALEARLRLWSSTRHLLAGRLPDAADEIRRAADLAQRAGSAEAETRIEALTDLAYIHQLTGDPRAEPTLREAFETAAAYGIDDTRMWETLITRAILDQHAGRLRQAEANLESLLERYGDLVGAEQLFAAHVALTDVRARSGDGPGALDAARHAARVFEDTDDSRGPALYAEAVAESVGGSLRRAAQLAEQGAATAERDGDRFWRLWNLTALGRARLLLGQAGPAAQVLREVRRIHDETGIVDPAIGRWQADLAEALIAQGELAEARAVIDEATGIATRLQRSGVLAALRRADALAHLAAGEAETAAELLRGAADMLRQTGEPLDLVRTLLATADVERRRRRRAAERDALAEARTLCQTTGAAAWLARVEQRAAGTESPRTARSETAGASAGDRGNSGGIGRGNGSDGRESTAGIGPGIGNGGSGGGRAGVGGGNASGRGRSAQDRLTPAERRVAYLAGAGATNREIAAACYLSVKTVEATLSRVYRKLEVRSRTELANLLPAPTDNPDA